MKIYSRRGDGGDTDLLGASGRWAKSADRVAALGAVDETNAAIGWALTLVRDLAGAEDMVARLGLIQEDLFTVGAHVGTPPEHLQRSPPKRPPLPAGRVEQMEAWIDEADSVLIPLRVFIIPGGTPAAAALHMARTTCRRAERAIARLGMGPDDQRTSWDEAVLRYLNRLSDLLFTMARLANHLSGTDDITWVPDGTD